MEYFSIIFFLFEKNLKIHTLKIIYILANKIISFCYERCKEFLHFRQRMYKYIHVLLNCNKLL